MRLLVMSDGDLYRLAVEEEGKIRPLLLPGEMPSWAGGWAGTDGTGRYARNDALTVLRSLGLSDEAARLALDVRAPAVR